MILKNCLNLKNSLFGLLSNVPFQSIRTTQASTIRKNVKYPDFTRSSLKEMVDKDAEEARKRQQELADIQAATYNNKYNDKNPANVLKVKVNPLSHIFNSQQTGVSTTTGIHENLSRPYIVLAQSRPEKIIAQGIRRKIPCSFKKMLLMTKLVRGRHIFDALAIAANLYTKAAKYLLYTLQQVRRHAIEKGLEEERLYVNSVMLGKNRRSKRLRYHAKGKSGMMISDTHQLTVRLEEKSLAEVYRNMIQGKFSLAFAYAMRKNLLNTDADYETIRKYQFVLTAKGRQQRKLMFKRAVLHKYLEYKSNGVLLTKKVIAEQLLNEETEKLTEAYRERRTAMVKNNLKSRQDLFKKNEENTAQ